MKKIKTVQLDISKNISSNFFYQAISIYLRKTQVVNRKLSCSVNVVFLKLNLSSCQNQEESRILENLCDDNSLNSPENVKNKLEDLGIEFVESDLDKLKEFTESDNGFYLSIERMLPRNLQKFKTCCVATFIGKSFSETCCFATK